MNAVQVPDPRLDKLAEWLFEAVQLLFGTYLRELGNGINTVVKGLEGYFEAVPVWLFILILAALAFRLRGWGFGAFVLVGFAIIEGMGLWSATMRSLALVVCAGGAAVLIGIPLGIIGARWRPMSRVLRPLLDFMQTMPAFVYLIPAVTFFSLGRSPALVATVIFSMPPVIRLTELGIRQVSKEVVEAAIAFGSTPNQLLFKVQLPQALPTVMAGVNQTIMLALSMVVIAGMIGAGGLGSIVLRAITGLDVGSGFEGGLAVVILAIFLDRFTEGIGHRLRKDE